MIVASTAALLGTSPDEPPRTRYVFEKTLESVSTELTAGTPAQRYVIALRADALGPDDVVTTTDATARVIGTITAAALEEGGETPFVDVAILPKNEAENEIRALTSFDASVSLDFAGNCEAPTVGEPCASELVIELRRLDDGARGGSITVDWQVELNATAYSRRSAPDVEDELPWTVEVAQP